MSVGQALPVARGRLPWRKLVLAGVAVATFALAAAAIGGYLWARSYDPLAFAGGTSGGPASTLEWTSVEDGVHDTVYYVSAEREGTFEVGFDVTNTGRFPVELEGLGPVTAFTGLRMARDGTWVDSEGADISRRIVPFAPITIEPGEGRYLVVQTAITAETACGPNYAPGSTRTLVSPSLRYRYLGIFERTATVEAPFTIVTACGGLPTADDVIVG